MPETQRLLKFKRPPPAVPSKHGPVPSDAETQIALERYLAAASEEPCPLCLKVVHGRCPKGFRNRTEPPPPPETPRTERVRRWDHLRKVHGIVTCDKCSLRLDKDSFYQHTLSCILTPLTGGASSSTPSAIKDPSLEPGSHTSAGHVGVKRLRTVSEDAVEGEGVVGRVSLLHIAPVAATTDGTAGAPVGGSVGSGNRQRQPDGTRVQGVRRSGNGVGGLKIKGLLDLNFPYSPTAINSSDHTLRGYVTGTGHVCPVCAKSVKPRLRAKRTEDGSEDEGDEDDVDVEDDKPSGTLRPEKQRRWDHLRKIHHVAVCPICSKYIPKHHLPEHRARCARKVAGK